MVCLRDYHGSDRLEAAGRTAGWFAPRVLPTPIAFFDELFDHLFVNSLDVYYELWHAAGVELPERLN